MTSEFLEYQILPIALPPLPAFPQSATHYLYIRPHSPKNPDPSAARSLFLVNVPIDATDLLIRHLFSTQIGLPSGRIEEVRFEDSKRGTSGQNELLNPAKPLSPAAGKKRKRNDGETLKELEADLFKKWDRDLHHSGSSAVVTFVDRTSMEEAVKAVKRVLRKQITITWAEGLQKEEPALGLQRYRAHHELCYPDQGKVLSYVDSYMTAYAEREAERARALARQRQEPDENGFVTVTRGGRIGPARHEEAREQLERQKKKQKGLDDFYRFQSREKRKEKAAQLVKRFEEDREKVRKMRERRGRFQPE